MSIWTFNIKDGYAEAILRGLRQAFLTPDDYRRLGLADTLEDLRTALEDTDYGNFLQDEMSPIAVTTIGMKCREKMAAEFRHLRSIANQPLIQFLDFIAAEKMIDNVVGLIQGTMNKKSPDELLARVDPLGWFPEMRAIASLDLSSGSEDLYRMLLVDTPIGSYFDAYIKSMGDHSHGSELSMLMTELDLELMRSALKRAWLEDFYAFCKKLGGITARVMENILMIEADFRVLSVTLNTINTPLATSSRLQDRNALYPSFGHLYPEGIHRIRKAWNDVTVRTALEFYPQYLSLYDQCRGYYTQETAAKPTEKTSEGAAATSAPSNSLEDLLFAEYVQICEGAFEEQFHYASTELCLVNKSMDSNALIKLLLAAEEEADKLVRQARENRAVKLKSAIKAAEEEIELFKKQEQRYFDTQLSQRTGASDTTKQDLQEQLKRDIDSANHHAKLHKNEVANYLVNAVTKVDLKLDPTQIRIITNFKDV